MKNLDLVLVSFLFASSAMAFRGGGGGGFRGGGMSVGVGVGGPRGSVGVGVGSGGNVGVGVGVHGTRGSVYAHRSAAMGAYYHPYSMSYWGWYGYAPYHYYYLPAAATVTVTQVAENKAVDEGTVVGEIPSDCKSEVVGGTTYKHCGVNWFLPQYSGTEIEYEAVKPPM